MTTTPRITYTNDKHILVDAPERGPFVEQLRSKLPDGSFRWGSIPRCWRIDVEHREKVEEIIASLTHEVST